VKSWLIPMAAGFGAGILSAWGVGGGTLLLLVMTLILGVPQQQAAAETVVKDALSVRQTELLVKKLTAEKKEKPQKDALSVNYVEEAARELGEKLGRPCRIVNGKKKGRIELEYYGTEDLNALLEALEKLGKR